MSLATPSCVQKLQTASHASLLNSEGVCLFREPDAGNLPVRFDEREQEIEPSQTGLRRALRKHPNSHREAKATAPVLDSTRRRDFFNEFARNRPSCGLQSMPKSATHTLPIGRANK